MCTCECVPHCTGLAETFIKLAITDGIQITFSHQLLSTCGAPCIADMFAPIATKLRTRVVIALGFARLNSCTLARTRVHLLMPSCWWLRYATTIKMLALEALDAGMMTSDWAWIGPLDIIRAEEQMIPGGDLRLQDAKQALSGWLYIADDRQFPEGFVDAVKASTAADFDITNKGDISPYALNLYDVAENPHSLCI